jgi:glycopeptide antibiotics resistance protein
MLILAVVYLSLVPQPPRVVDFNQSDKLAHLLAYAVLFLWFANIYPNGRRRIWFTAGFLAVGVCLELLQALGGHRSFQYADMLANGLGILAGWSLAKTRFGTTLLHLDRWLLHIREQLI